MILQLFKTIGAIFFISGGIIGIVSLGVPYSLAVAGIFPGFLMTIFVWLITFSIALCYLETILSLPDGSNLFSMTRRYLGKIFSFFVIIAFFFFYTFPLLSAYLISLGPLIQLGLKTFFEISLPLWACILCITLLIAIILKLGLTVALVINFFLSAALAYVSYHLLKQGASFEITHTFFNGSYQLIVYAIPVLYSAWGFQTILPTISTLLKRKKIWIIVATFFGTFLPLLCFLSLEWLVLTTVREEDFWIAFDQAQPVVEGLKLIKTAPWYSSLVDFFALFSQSGCLLVNAYALLDILYDIRRVNVSERRGVKRFLYILIVLFIPFVAACFLPSLVLNIIVYSLNISDFFLSVCVLAAIWILRYRLSLNTPKLLFGGKVMIIFLFFCFFYFFWIQGLSALK